MQLKFYKNKRILVTGHTGFVGSWLTLLLSSLDTEIIGFSLHPPSKPYLYNYLNLNKKIINIKADISNPLAISKTIKEYKPEIIIHLAAQPVLLDSYETPRTTFMTNTIGTLNLLEAERKYGNAKTILCITTDKVYENNGITTYKETDRLGGFDPYSSSKSCAELIINSYRRSFLQGIGIATARAGNIIGGGDWGRHRIIPDLISNKKVTIRYPNAIRPWTYILDVLDGYMTLIESLNKNPETYSEGWNFSSNSNKTVIELVKEVKKYRNINYEIKKGKLHEEKSLLLNSTKSKRRLGWKAKYSFEETISHTIFWYNNFDKAKTKNDIYKLTLKQLQDYFQMN